MKKKEITLYDSYYSREKENEIRAFLFEIYADEENWNSPEEIPDQRVYDEMTFQDGETWRDIKDGLNTIFEDGYYLLTGYCGTWRGRLDGGNFIRSLDDLSRKLRISYSKPLTRRTALSVRLKSPNKNCRSSLCSIWI